MRTRYSDIIKIIPEGHDNTSMYLIPSACIQHIK